MRLEHGQEHRQRTSNEAKARLNIESVKRKGGWFWIAGEDEDSDDDD